MYTFNMLGLNSGDRKVTYHDCSFRDEPIKLIRFCFIDHFQLFYGQFKNFLQSLRLPLRARTLNRESSRPFIPTIDPHTQSTYVVQVIVSTTLQIANAL